MRKQTRFQIQLIQMTMHHLDVNGQYQARNNHATLT